MITRVLTSLEKRLMGHGYIVNYVGKISQSERDTTGVSICVTLRRHFTLFCEWHCYYF